MGDPKFPHKTYSTPRHPWQKERIDSEKELLVKFGLKNKRELWKGMEMLKSFRSQARDLQARMRTNDPNAEKQFQALIRRLGRYNILGHNASLDDVLSLSIEDILSRRLQTIVFRKNLARTPKQARQMITHGHVTMDGRRVTVPGMLVEGHLEETIIYHGTSPFTDDLHPIRQVILNGPAGYGAEQEEGQEGETEATGEAKPEQRSFRRDRSRREAPRFGRQQRPRNVPEKPKVEVRPKIVEKKEEPNSAEKESKPVKEEKLKLEEPKEEKPKKEAPKAEPKEEAPKVAKEVKPEKPKAEELKEEKPKEPKPKEEKPKAEPTEEAGVEEKPKTKKTTKPKEPKPKEEKPKKSTSKSTKTKEKEPKEA